MPLFRAIGQTDPFVRVTSGHIGCRYQNHYGEPCFPYLVKTLELAAGFTMLTVYCLWNR